MKSRNKILKRTAHETERLILRPYRKSDYRTWYDAYVNRLPKQGKYDRDPSDPKSCSKEIFYKLMAMHEQLAAKDSVYIYGVFEKEMGQLVGAIDIAIMIRENYQMANLGYQIHNRFWRKGYGVEATRAGILLGFDELKIHRLEAAINIDNDASIALARAVGMHCEGIRKHYLYEDQSWVDHVIFSAIPEHFGRRGLIPWSPEVPELKRSKNKKIKRT